MYELKDYQSILGEKSDRLKSFFVKYPEDSAQVAKTFDEINEKKIRSVEPEIMVYGIYNAGKSSILNELMGKDIAAVNPIPTTDKVTYYDWQGYKIADTPGIFAPIEHQQVTQEHLKKADIVLFVMGTTGSNEKKENYDRLKEISDAGKKIIIVLNDKNGDLGKKIVLNDKNGDLGENEDVIQIIKRKVAENMLQVGIKDDNKYCIVTVNALRAYNGRHKNKPGMIAKSGMDELKNVILTELKSTTSFDILRNGIREIEKVIEEFIDELKKHENSEVIKKMNNVLENINERRISMRRHINGYIEDEALTLGENLPQIIWSHSDNQDAINGIVAEELERLNNKVQNRIQEELKDMARDFEVELKSFAEIKIGNRNADAEAFKNILSKLSSGKEIPAETTALVTAPDQPKELDLSNVSTAGIAGGMLAESAKAIAKTSLGKAVASTALGKLLFKAVPVVGPLVTIISVAGALKDWLGNNDDFEKAKQQIAQQNEANKAQLRQYEEKVAAVQARQELNQKCRYFADNIADDLKSTADKSIAEILTKYEEPFKAELKNLKDDAAGIGNDIIKLRELYNEYDLVCVELGAK